MIKYLCFLTVLSSGFLFADSPCIEKIVLTNDEQMSDEILVDSKIDIRIPCDKKELEKVLSPFLGKEIAEENLRDLKKSISEFLAKTDNSLHLVQIPEQKVSDGQITVHIFPAQVDQVTVTGNRWFSSSSILSAMDVYSCDEVRESTILNDIAWVNRNPMIRTDVVLSPGKERKQVNLEILVKDRFPARFYAGADNTGSSFSGNERFFVGVNYAVGLKNFATYQFTSGYSFPKFQSHFGNWTIYLPWKHQAIFYGGYATIHPEITGFTTQGDDIQLSMRYVVPIKPLYTPFQHQFTWGVDYKKTNSSLFFLGEIGDPIQVVNDKTAELFQIMAAYQLEHSWDRFQLTFQTQNFVSPAKFLKHQSSVDYDSLRPGAVLRYYYNRTSFGLTYHMPKRFSVSALIRGQVASDALLPSEQFGLGGYDTVRGYQERIALFDNAIVGNFELRTPTVSLFRTKRDELFFLLFVDTAYGYNWQSSASFNADSFLMGVGPGFRYYILPYLSARVDYGFRIHNTLFSNDQIGRFHFSFTAGY